MAVSWAEVVGLIGVAAASRLNQEGMTVVTDMEAETLNDLTKFVQVAFPALEAIASGKVHHDAAPSLASNALAHLKSQGVPTPCDDLRLQLKQSRQRQADARRVIRELLSVTPIEGNGQTLVICAKASAFLRDMK